MMSTKRYSQFDDLITFTRASGGTYLDSDGLLKTASNNIPRIEYDSSGSRLGLLIEESRTNLVTYSEDFSQWSKTNNPTVTINSALSPDGTINASALLANGTAGYQQITVTPTLSDNTDYALSLYFKAAVGSSGLRFALSAKDGVTRYMTVLSDGSLSTVLGATSVSVTSVGSGWYKATCVINAYTGVSTPSLRVYLTDSSGSIVTLVDGNGLYIYGAQLEAGAFPTSYIATSGATATRSADVASISTDAFGFNANAGSFVLNASWAGDASDVSAIVNLGSSTDRHLLYYNSGSFRYQVKSGNVVTSQLTAVGGEEDDVIAASYKTDSFFLSDGSGVSSDASGDLPDEVLTALDIGGYLSGNYFNGHIKSIRYYPRALTATQLQEITS